MQKPTWNIRQDDLERVHQMRKAMAVPNALFRRPKQRANIQRRHQPILGGYVHAEQVEPLTLVEQLASVESRPWHSLARVVAHQHRGSATACDELDICSSFRSWEERIGSRHGFPHLVHTLHVVLVYVPRLLVHLILVCWRIELEVAAAVCHFRTGVSLPNISRMSDILGHGDGMAT
ncbi:hypothetical protein AC1031_001397 [Aphanomyces cochlioides]|nr:hypothetical protein AC1031_001397 [Aphanomyces cochlioides]